RGNSRSWWHAKSRASESGSMKPVLLLVDLQNDFLRAGDLEPHPASIVAAAADLLNTCRTGAVPVVPVWSTANKSGDNRMPHRKRNGDWMCLEGSAGHACPDVLRPHKKETIIHKIFFSAFSTGQLDYFQDVWTSQDVERYPSFLDFATSSDVLSVVSHYLQSIPVLSTTLPPGIRFTESNAAFDDQPDNPRNTHLYHLEYYSMPNVYVIVLLRDTTIEHGPWTFFPRSISQKARVALNYWSRQHGYR